MDIVNQVKEQYARILQVDDWGHLLEVASFHFKNAAKLKKKDVNHPSHKLLIRNSLKRLHLGIGMELLLKAAFLKNGICVNKLINLQQGQINAPQHQFDSLNANQINPKDTFTLGALISKINIILGDIDASIVEGMKIAMTFRNKEGHISFPKHEFDESNYQAIEASVTYIYENLFDLKVHFKISMISGQKGTFKFLK
ncbi:hypothetical protein [Pseudoalteromonas lipolytica]|uniref:Uncharacterized protein n=1 Tax=Pseudoalteromonas lipolytica TaxID=570156 RepID=A0ABU8SVM1_9GAMM